MRVPQSYVQKCKVGAHVLQSLLIFIAGCITIAVLTKGGTNGGPTKYYFALCFLTLPALVYLAMVPMWSRAVRFANAYAFVALDALYTIFWFAAFIAVAVWNAAGIREGAKDKKVPDGDGNCSTFKYGPEDKCVLSRATFGFGVVIWILFALTTAISVYYLLKFRKDGVFPFQSAQPDAHRLGGDDSLKPQHTATNLDGDAWAADTHDLEHRGSTSSTSSDYDRRTDHGSNQQADEYALLHGTDTDEGRHPGRPLNWGDDSRYANPSDPAPPYASYAASNALSDGYEEYRSQTAGTNYAAQPSSGAAMHRGYSFSGGDELRS